MCNEAYVAGLFDADGIINYYGNWQIKVAIGMQDRDLLEWLQENWGGKIYLHGRVWRWELLRKDERVALLEAIAPYSRTKVEQVNLLLEHFNGICTFKGLALREEFHRLTKKHTLAGPWEDKNPSTESKGNE